MLSKNQENVERKNEIKISDKVTMNNKYYVSDENKKKIWTVQSEPWNLCGTEVVLLDGKRGGYAVDGLNLVEETEGV